MLLLQACLFSNFYSSHSNCTREEKTTYKNFLHFITLLYRVCVDAHKCGTNILTTLIKMNKGKVFKKG